MDRLTDADLSPSDNEAELRRVAFTTSRALEFFSEKELAMQIGCPRPMWPVALTKELIDNGLDGCENAGRRPCIKIVVEADAVGVQDNGPGLPLATLKGSLNYAVRVSDKAYYVSPTRGQLGNALKCVWAAPFVANGNQAGRVEVITEGRRHLIDVTVDRIAQVPRLSRTDEPAVVQDGTFVKMYWPGIASCLSVPETPDLYKSDDFDDDLDRVHGAFDVHRLVQAYAAFNPHATFLLTRPGRASVELAASNPRWQKWLPRKPTSPHWYDLDRFQALIGANLAEERSSGQRRTVRDFVSEFNGLKRSNKQRVVTQTAVLAGEYLHDLVRDGAVDAVMAGRLLEAMKAAARPVKPEALGVLGRAHLLHILERHHNVDPESVRYKIAPLSKSFVNGVPFVLEMATGIRSREKEQQGREILVGLNWSPALKPPSEELTDLLGRMRVDPEDPVVVLVHLAFPRLEVMDHGKSTLAALPEPIRHALDKCGTNVLREWKKAKRHADQEGRVRQQQLQKLRKAMRKRTLSVTEAAYRVMEQAYLETSDNNQYPANARQIMYKARPLVLQLTGDCWKKSSTFTQHLLPDFIKENPDLTAKWDVVYDARGRFVEPHTNNRVDLGTVQVRQYIGAWKEQIGADRPDLRIDSACPTMGPKGRYDFVLFIEKEGFAPLLEKAAIAKRYDLAIMSTKGMSVTASRTLVERLSEQEVTILVLRDFDKAGFSIAHTLRTNTRRYQFNSQPNVLDLGLRLKDITAMHLLSETVEYRGGKNKKKPVIDPRIRLRECNATEAECAFLVREQTAYGWIGERVELNAMSSPQFIEFLERKLTKAGVRKVIPDSEHLAGAYRRAVEVALLNQGIKELADEIHEQAQEMKVPRNLKAQVTARLKESPELSWDQVLAELAEGQV